MKKKVVILDWFNIYIYIYTENIRWKV
jgi:hypothetical protein